MKYPYTLPLFDREATPGSWNERMQPGEFAVHPSTSKGAAAATCTVLPSLDEAVRYAEQQISAHPELRCRIYDHHGFVGAPLHELTGPKFKGELDLSPRVRRWLGAAMLLAGIVLTGIDWVNDFKLSWPSLVGTRLLIPGLVLLAVEGLVELHNYQKRREAERKPS